MKAAGWTLIAIAGAVIFYNVVVLKEYNRRQVQDSPLLTIFSGGANLAPRYSFTPPYDAFEIFIFGVGITGIVLLVLGYHQERKARDEEARREDEEEKGRGGRDY